MFCAFARQWFDCVTALWQFVRAVVGVPAAGACGASERVGGRFDCGPTGAVGWRRFAAGGARRQSTCIV